MGVLGAAHKAVGNRLRAYPAHPPFIQNFKRNKDWKMIEASKFRTPTFRTKTKNFSKLKEWSFKPRFTGSIFEYKGASMNIENAIKLVK